MGIAKDIQSLCTPAYVYLVISVISIVIMMFQNGGNDSIFCLGNYKCDVQNTGTIFLGQIIYSIFWVFLLNFICKKGYKNVSWFLVLLPFIFLFIGLGVFMLSGAEKAIHPDHRHGNKHGH